MSEETRSPLSAAVLPVKTTDLSQLNVADYKDPEIQKNIQNAIDYNKEYMDALEKRYAQPNWFKVAAGFAKPQLGGFLASLGSASEALGENVEQQRAMAPTIAQMRSQNAIYAAKLGQAIKSAKLSDELVDPKTGLINPDVARHQAELQSGPGAGSKAYQEAQSSNVNMAAQKLSSARSIAEAINTMGEGFVRQYLPFAMSIPGFVPPEGAKEWLNAQKTPTKTTTPTAPAGGTPPAQTATPKPGSTPVADSTLVAPRGEGARLSHEYDRTHQDWADPNYHVEAPPAVGGQPHQSYLDMLDKNRDQMRDETASLSRLISADPNFLGRRTNLAGIANSLKDKDIREFSKRGSEQELSSLVAAAMRSDTAPAALRDMVSQSHFIKPGEDESKVTKFQDYIRELAKEQQFINNQTLNATNAKFGMEQSAGIKQGTQPGSVNRYVQEELHKMQYLATLSGLIQPYADAGYNLSGALNSKRVSDYRRDWENAHNLIAKYQNRYGLPPFLADPNAFSPGFDYRVHRKAQ